MDFRMGKNNGVWRIARIAITAFFLLFFAYPMVLIFIKVIEAWPETISLFAKTVVENSNLLWNSFYQAFLSTFFSVLIGVPAGFIIARRSFPGKKIIKAVSLIPFVFPSILVVISFIIIFGNNGWINNFLINYLGFSQHVQFLYGLGGIILAHTFYNFPLVMRFVSDAWEKLDKSMKETAESLGAGRMQVFMRITLPQLTPAILSGAALVFIYTFMSFTIVISLGSIMYSTFEVEIYRQITRNLNFGLGSLLALFQFALLAGVVLIYMHYSKKHEIKEKAFIEKPEKLSLNSVQGIVETFFLVMIVLFVFLPLAALFVFAFSSPETGELSLNAFEKIFSSNASLLGTTPMHAVFFSLIIAFISSITAVLAGLAASLKQSRVKELSFLLSMSIAVSVITLGFGYLMGFGSGFLPVIIIGHAVLAFPFAFRIISNALNKIDNESIEVAETLGADKTEIFKRIQLPRIKNSVYAALTFAFAVSLGELGFIMVLYDGIYPTMPVYIYRLLATFNLPAAAAMGIILIFISFLCFYSIEVFSKNEQVF